MKNLNFLLVAGLFVLSACGGKEHLPQNPKDKEEYRDSQGNHWIYNAMLYRWALMPSGGNASSPSYFYYPGKNSWTNANGVTVAPPSTVKESTYRVPSVKPNSTKSVAPSQNKSSKPSGKSFGSSYRSKPIGG